MITNIGLYSYLIACVSFGILSTLLLLSGRDRPYANLLICASLSTACWAGIIAFGTLVEYPPIILITLTELARDAIWILLLLKMASLQFEYSDNAEKSPDQKRIYSLFTISCVIACTSMTLPALLDHNGIFATTRQTLTLAIWLIIAIVGLVLMEQLYRNASVSERWSVKYLCIGLSFLFGYDFFMYAEGLLFQTLDPNLWQARGLVSAIAVPLLAVAIARNSDWQSSLHVSRKVVFHSVTLIAAGLYLIAMSLMGYAVRYFGGTWGSVLQTTFLVAAGSGLVVILFSASIRAQMKVLLSKHFFSYKYDYRDQWLNFTRALADMGDNVPDGIVRAMVPLVGAEAGLLLAPEADHYRLISYYQMPEPEGNLAMSNLPVWITQTEWVIDVDEYQREPEKYSGLQLPTWVWRISQPWLIVPLMFADQLAGILIIRKSDLTVNINWEERDLLKTAGRQAASHLAQYNAHQALVEARQFDAFNRLSAYVIHDLKNILAQQSLIVSNAEKHKHNPAFVDDMIITVNNSVDRMTRLMEQMRSGLRDSQPEEINLAQILVQVVQGRSNQSPCPTFDHNGMNSFRLQADHERLTTVFNHIIQNAQEACDRDGHVEISLSQEGDCYVVQISDNGKGMDADFIANRLFTPFESTKGLTGMGIGAFESRDYIRSLGGDIKVTSRLANGSIFRVYMPVSTDTQSTKEHSAMHIENKEA
ncbi:MAG: XrtA/PEP-CTERM system histidine kinase PrsK [Parahaliea sp.]